MTNMTRKLVWNQLKKEYQHSSRLFEDPDNPEISKQTVTINYTDGSSKDLPVELRRPQDICRGKKPEMTVDGVTCFDLEQGSLGNCWFVAGAAHLATNKKLFRWVIPDDQDFGDNYFGAFHFWFYYLGEWEEVIIDDLLPCYDLGREVRLLYMRNRNEPNEFWAPLLEKAFAKLHGSYQALDAGNAEESMIAISGGVGFKIPVEPHGFYDKLLKWASNKILLACSPKNRPADKSIQTYHAYSITKVQQVTDQHGKLHSLLCLRNPWGSGEWDKDWSDASTTWSLLPDHKAKELNRDKMDGEFWMKYSDFEANFEKVSGCVVPKTKSDAPRYVYTRSSADGEHSAWDITQCPPNALMRGVTAGGPYGSPSFWSNPQYIIDIEDKDEDDRKNVGTLILTIGKKAYRKHVPSRKPTALSFDLFKIEKSTHERLNEKNAPKYIKAHLQKGKHEPGAYKEDVIYTYSPMEVEPGRYLLVPSSDDPIQDVKFYLKLSSDKKITADLSDDRTEVRPHSKASVPDSALENLFHVWTKECHQLDARKLLQILNKMLQSRFSFEKEDIHYEASRSLISVYDKDKSGRVDLEELQDIWSDVVEVVEYLTQHGDQYHCVDVSSLKSTFQAVRMTLGIRVLQTIAIRYATEDDKVELGDFIMIKSKIQAVLTKLTDGADCTQNPEEIEKDLCIALEC